MMLCGNNVVTLQTLIITKKQNNQNMKQQRMIIVLAFLFLSLMTFSSTVFAQRLSEKVERIEIEYTRVVGYGTTKAKAIYKYNPTYDTFMISHEDWKKYHNAIEVPIGIADVYVMSFLDNWYKSQTDSCSYYSISKEDLSAYKELISNCKGKKGFLDYLDLSLYLPNDTIDENLYLSIPDETLLNLSCEEIYKALHTGPTTTMIVRDSNFRITIYFLDGKKMEITPYDGYESPWVVIYGGKNYLINHHCGMWFVTNIGFDRFVLFADRSLMTFHVVNYLLHQ